MSSERSAPRWSHRWRAATLRAVGRALVRLVVSAVVAAPVSAQTAAAPLAPVRAETQGAEVIVVRVPLPTAIRLDGVMSMRPAAYRIAAGRYVQELGATSGTIDPARDSVLVVALRVSRRAPAGRSPGATVEFRVGTVTAAVPIEVDVPARHALSLAIDAKTLLATRGRWTTVPLRVLNAGNVDEQAAVAIGTPPGWRADVRAAGRPQRVAPGQSLALSLRLWIPAQANSGLAILPVRLVRPGERDTTEQLQVDVIGDLSREQAGARVTTSIISGVTTDQQQATAYALGLTGHLSDSTTVTGRASYAGALTTAGSRGLLLARSGMLTGPPVLELRNPQWQLQAGSALVPLPELAGQHLAGIGGAATIRRAAWSATAFDLRPLGTTMTASLLPLGSGRLQGAEVGVGTPVLRSSAFASRLSDRLTRRDLTAIGLRFGVGEAGRAQLLSEVAYRDVAGQRGVGIATTFQRTGARSFVEARAMHAPGGSAGFARAVDDVTLSASRSFGTRGFLALNAWTQRDANPLLGALRNHGWSVSPALDVKRFGTVGLDLRGVGFRSTVEAARLGNDEVSGGGMWTQSLLGTSIIARSSLARVDRSLVDGAWRSQSRQWRLDHSVSLLRGAARGALQANWTLQQFSALAGSLPAQQSVHLRAERLRPRLASPLSFEAELQRMQIGASGPVFWTARSGATLDLRLGLSVTVAAERNPFLNMMARGARPPMAYTLRVDRTNLVPRLMTGARNHIFRDDNGNGRRDRGESGVGGVVIRCGARLVQSDGEGRFSCGEREQTLDPRTVPVGLLASRLGVTYGQPVALRVVQPVRVTLTLSGTDSLRVHADMLRKAIVYARDSVGALWYARIEAAGQYVLEALPLGRYTIGVDASALDEPLTVAGGAPVVEVGGRGVPAPVVVGLRSRPVRVKSFDATSPGLVPSPVPAAVTRPLQRAPRHLLARARPTSRLQTP